MVIWKTRSSPWARNAKDNNAGEIAKAILVLHIRVKETGRYDILMELEVDRREQLELLQ